MANTGTIVLSWPAEPGALSYTVRWHRESPTASNWATSTVQAPGFRAENQISGVYRFDISSNGLFGSRSSPTTFYYTLNVEAAIDQKNFEGLGEVTLVPVTPDLGLMEWYAPSDEEALVLIRHQESDVSGDWSKSAAVLPPVLARNGHAYVPLLDGFYTTKLAGGVLTTSVRAYAPKPQPVLTVYEQLENPLFDGTKDGLIVSTELGGLVVGSSTTIDDLAVGEDLDTSGSVDLLGQIDAIVLWDSSNDFDDILEVDLIGPGWDAIPMIDTAGGTATTGTYTFKDTFDAGAVYSLSVRRLLELRTITTGALWDGRLNDVDTWADVDQLAPGDSDVTVWYQSSKDGGIWSGWQPLVNNQVVGRYFRFEATIEVYDPSETVVITKLGARITAPQTARAATTSDLNVNFDNPFYSIPAVNISGMDTESGDYFKVTSVTRTGMQVEWYNASGDPVSRQFSYLATGFGQQTS